MGFLCIIVSATIVQGGGNCGLCESAIVLRHVYTVFLIFYLFGKACLSCILCIIAVCIISSFHFLIVQSVSFQLPIEYVIKY
jgi:hypothetical protein